MEDDLIENSALAQQNNKISSIMHHPVG